MIVKDDPFISLSTEIDQLLHALRDFDHERTILRTEAQELTIKLHSIFHHVILPLQNAFLMEHFSSFPLGQDIWELFISIVVPSWYPSFLYNDHIQFHPPNDVGASENEMIIKVGVVTGNLNDNNGGMALLNLMKSLMKLQNQESNENEFITNLFSAFHPTYKTPLENHRSSKRVQFILILPLSFKKQVETYPSTISEQIMMKFHSIMNVTDLDFEKAKRKIQRSNFDILLFPDIFYSSRDSLPFYLSLQRIASIQGCFFSESKSPSVCHQDFILTPPNCGSSWEMNIASSSNKVMRDDMKLKHIPIPTLSVVQDHRIGAFELHQEDIAQRNAVGGTTFFQNQV